MGDSIICEDCILHNSTFKLDEYRCERCKWSGRYLDADKNKLWMFTDFYKKKE